MVEWTIEDKDEGQRLLRFLTRQLPEASQGFLHKMLRKKNITVDGRRAEGSDRLVSGSVVRCYFADETIRGFGGVLPADRQGPGSQTQGAAGTATRESLTPEGDPDDHGGAGALVDCYTRLSQGKTPPRILYEDAELMAIYKPRGILSQRAAAEDDSVNEYLLGYLLAQRKRTEADFKQFRPSVQNRLDRNTDGIILCALSYRMAALLQELLKEHKIRKVYHMLLEGECPESGEIRLTLVKNAKSNTVSVIDPVSRQSKPGQKGDENPQLRGAKESMTRYRRIRVGRGWSLVEAELLTGRSHQLRVSMAHLGHPILGDGKYGSTLLKTKKIRHTGQLLSNTEIGFPVLSAPFEAYSKLEVQLPLPREFDEIMKQLG